MARADIWRRVWRMFLLQQLSVLLLAPVTVYNLTLVMGLTGEQTLWLAARFLPHTTLIFGSILPLAIIYGCVKWGMEQRPGEQAGEALSRLLKVPRAIELLIQVNYGIGIGQYALIAWFVFPMSWLTIPWATAVSTLLTMLVMIWGRLAFERELAPVVQERLLKTRSLVLRGGGLLWPRHTWYLPYAFGIFVLNTLMTTLTVLVGKSRDVINLLPARLEGIPSERVLEVVAGASLQIVRDSTLPIVLTMLFLMVSAGLSAWSLARQQKQGAQAVSQAIESLAAGRPQPPRWLSTDEIGDLSQATTRIFEKLMKMSAELGGAAEQLGQSAQQLSMSNERQRESLALQASALQETQVTAQEIKQTSTVAAQKAESVLKTIEEADTISRMGEEVIGRSMQGLKDIREHVTNMASQISSLSSRAEQIYNIIETVKDLADQSNILALNAAIEASRSGEAGRGFGVIAQEIRGLADQSIAATGNVRSILQDIGKAIQATVAMTTQGAQRIESNLEDVGTFGENIRKLSDIVSDNASAVRQISASVNQQNAGVAQIFEAILSLSDTMNESTQRLQETAEAMAQVQSVSTKVGSLMSIYDWSEPSTGSSARRV